LVCFGIVAAVPVLILGVNQARRWERVQLEEVDREGRLAVESLAREIAQYVESHTQAVEALAAQVQALRSFDPVVVRPIISAQKTRFGRFSFMYIAARDGRSVVTEPAFDRNGQTTTGTDYSDRDYYRQLLTTRDTAISRVQVGKRTGVPNIQIAAPILDGSGRLTGFAEGSLDLTGIQEAAARVVQGVPGLQAAVLDETGRVIAHPDAAYRASVRSLGMLPLFQPTDDSRVLLRSSQDTEGVMMRAAVSAMEFRGLRWTAVVYRPVALIQEQAAIARRHAMLVAGIALVAGLGFAAVLAAGLVGPVRRLVAAASVVGKGHFVLPTQPGRWVPREVAALQRALRDMIVQLREYTTDLEQRVEERTAQLTDMNRALEAQSAETRRKARYLEALYDASRLLHTEAETAELYRKLLDVAQRATGARYAAIRTLDDQGRLDSFVHAGFSEEERAILQAPPEDVGVLGALTLTNRIVRLDDLTRDARHRGYPAGHPVMRSFLGVAIASGDRLFGKLYLTEKANGAVFTEEDEALVVALSHDAALAIEKARLYKKVEALATMDALTGLGNRRVLDERLRSEIDRARRYKKALGLLMADVDNFKPVNDTYGHGVGDSVLQAVAAVLRQAVREIDVCVRYGGEEFAVILPHAGTESVLVVAERIRAMVAAVPIVAAVDPIRTLTISIGVATYPGNGRSAEQLIEAADAALYRAKRKGKNRVETAPPLAA
jgi:diguanylate cyclase (GGDEF)-like protein